MTKMVWCGAAVPCLVLGLLLALSGCGQKGQLYFPKDKPAAMQPLQQN